MGSFPGCPKLWVLGGRGKGEVSTLLVGSGEAAPPSPGLGPTAAEGWVTHRQERQDLLPLLNQNCP